MKFGPVPTEACDGAVLAHALNLPDGRIRKGTRLAGTDLDRIRAAGITEIVVARLETGDMTRRTAVGLPRR